MGDIGPVHHTGITVRNLDRSVRFYREVLGCILVAEQEKRGGYLAEIVGYPDASVRMAHLRDPSGRHIIELFEYQSPPTRDVSLQPCQVGNAHLCFLVADLEKTYQRLRISGADLFSAPIVVDTGINAGGKGLYLRDPDGVTLELFQPAVGSASWSLLESDS